MNKPYDKDTDRHMGEGIEQGSLIFLLVIVGTVVLFGVAMELVKWTTPPFIK